MKNAFGDLKPQTREEAISIRKEVEEITIKINKDVEELMRTTKEYIKRKMQKK